MSLIDRIASAAIKKASLSVGGEYQTPNLRVHRYRDSIQVTDLTFAGKRGKKCGQFWIQPDYRFPGDVDVWFDTVSKELVKFADQTGGYQKSLSFAKGLLENHPDDLKLSENDLKGVDVEPFGEKIEGRNPQSGFLDGYYAQYRISPTNFSVQLSWQLRKHTPEGSVRKDVANDNDTQFVPVQTTGYYPVKKADAVLFYRWALENKAKLGKLLTEADFSKVWKELGVRYDYH